MVALRHPSRLCEIDLHVTSSMLASIIQVTQKQCHAIESIRITVDALTGPSLLVGDAFLGGSARHLREIKLDGIAFPFLSIRKFFYPPQISLSFTLATSQTTLIFHQMT